MINFEEVKGKITLHGLGFIQIKMGNNCRMYVWHPDLPRRKCYEYSAIHNHRFGFKSTVLKGELINYSYYGYKHYQSSGGLFDVINHNGPRMETGSRKSFFNGSADITNSLVSVMEPGDVYEIKAGEFHSTLCHEPVITFMEKLEETEIPAKSLIEYEAPMTFDFEFDRYQLSEEELYSFVLSAIKY